MAQRLAQTALRTSNLVHGGQARLINARFRSGGASRYDAELIEVDLSELSENNSSNNNTNNEIEVFGINRLEDAIHRIIVRRTAPDWLPFLPGSSYWVPPRQNSKNAVNNDILAKLRGNTSLTEEEVISLFAARGWPSSPYYVDGASSPHPEKEVAVINILSVGEDGEEG